jgi:hypothetical protein
MLQGYNRWCDTGAPREYTSATRDRYIPGLISQCYPGRRSLMLYKVAVKSVAIEVLLLMYMSNRGLSHSLWSCSGAELDSLRNVSRLLLTLQASMYLTTLTIKAISRSDFIEPAARSLSHCSNLSFEQTVYSRAVVLSIATYEVCDLDE